MTKLKNFDFRIQKLGTCKVNSPREYSTKRGDSIANFTRDNEYIIRTNTSFATSIGTDYDPAWMMEEAGPREKIYFSPSHVNAAIVTCGGLCPGLNDVIRSITRTLWYFYGVERINGIRYGYRGFRPEFNYPPMRLDPDIVDDIHKLGGTMLGSSRGYGDAEPIVDALERMNINVLFTIGGDGTQRGNLDIMNEIEKRNLKIACVGVPKTIDNDIMFVHQSFGFNTAVSKAVEAVSAAHVEAKSAADGIGLVKVMGRDSGFIAAHTTLSTSDVNFCLIPEAPFTLEGENGLLTNLEKRLDKRHHAVILVAEGAGQEHLAGADTAKDASGNKLYNDIGEFLKKRISDYLRQQGREVNIKYIDPSYIIRAAPANPVDAHYCARLGANAVHAAMCGRTGCIIGQWNNALVHVPIPMATRERKKVDCESALWRDVLESTRQPIRMFG
ncbi:MAG: diphosphate--fructose-6-phosphate 1-phosphotransferase [Spirochaeta sp. LUC14_002_19_P3]|nr:MAG: diphosphate--fructose-6-phosphate 1-phosphotransferase [Spirochaeta sp. LUC14_002_19_P3]